VGPWQVMIYGIGSMLGAGIYALIGKVAGVMGSMVWLAFAAAMVAALLTGFTYACVGSRFPKAGGAAYITQQAFGRPWLSYVVGIAVMMSGLTSMATGAQAIAENLDQALGDILPIKLVAIGLVALLGMVIFAGIRQSRWMNMI
jgi:amino acid transporter